MGLHQYSFTRSKQGPLQHSPLSVNFRMNFRIAWSEIETTLKWSSRSLKYILAYQAEPLTALYLLWSPVSLSCRPCHFSIKVPWFWVQRVPKPCSKHVCMTSMWTPVVSVAFKRGWLQAEEGSDKTEGVYDTIKIQENKGRTANLHLICMNLWIRGCKQQGQTKLHLFVSRSQRSIHALST